MIYNSHRDIFFCFSAKPVLISLDKYSTSGLT